MKWPLIGNLHNKSLIGIQRRNGKYLARRSYSDGRRDDEARPRQPRSQMLQRRGNNILYLAGRKKVGRWRDTGARKAFGNLKGRSLRSKHTKGAELISVYVGAL